jgi:hypothetical protein
MLPTLAPQNMTEAMEYSKILATSNMVPAGYKGKPQDILVAIGWGYEVGLQPMQALQNIAVINGKPSVYGDAALALVKADSRCAGVKEWIEGEGDDMTAHCLVKRRYNEDMEETVATFSVMDAKQARLWGKQGPWQQYPKRMLAMRARGFAIRDAFPDAMKGMITAEEAQDYPTQTRDVTPKANPLDANKPPVEAVQEASAQSRLSQLRRRSRSRSQSATSWACRHYQTRTRWWCCCTIKPDTRTRLKQSSNQAWRSFTWSSCI